MLLRRAGRTLHADLLGDPGRPVVLLVHALAADTGLWREQVPALLEGGHSVLRADLPGHGGSAPPSGTLRMADLAADLAFLLDTLAVGPVDYVGLSLGGMAGQALALERPDLLRSVVVCDALPESLPDAGAIWGPRIRAVREAASAAPVAAATIERWLTPAFRLARPDRWDEILSTITNTHPDGYAACAEAISNFSHVARLPDLAVPALVLCGEDDTSVPPAEGRRIAALVPDGRFEAIPGARHLPNVERPGLFNRLLLDWLARGQG